MMVKVKYRFSSILVAERKKQLAEKRKGREEATRKFGYFNAQRLLGPRSPNLKGSPFLSRFLKRMGE